MTPHDIAQLILTRVADPEEAAVWVAVVLAESGGDPHAVNMVDHDRHADAFRSVDLGLFQLNTYWHGERLGRCTPWEALEPAAAWSYAWAVATNSGAHTSMWDAWVTYTTGAHDRHLQAARAAVADVLAEEAPAVTLYPIGYRSQRVTLEELRAVHEPKMHPEFARRLFNWIEAQDGKFGVGGGWRQTQPDRPGFAPEGRSFHQSQTFASGFVGYAAVDLVVAQEGGVHRSPTWDEVPAQGSPEAARWGVHCNVGTPGTSGSEAWHMQPVELDGHAGWVAAGSPDPDPAYRIPNMSEEDPEMELVRVVDGSTKDAAVYAVWGPMAWWVQSVAEGDAIAAEYGCERTPREVPRSFLKTRTLFGQQPSSPSAGVITSHRDFLRSA